ncbi:hypothetical protein HTV80_00165 [Streptomyces sp. Vc74B-19]|nr:hypothetical protein [Streptomyces sp. Vc74B-19]
MARACCCDDYFTVDPVSGELCLQPGTMGLRDIVYFTNPGTALFRKADYPWLARVKVRVQGAGGGSAGANAAQNNAVCRPGAGAGAYGESLIEASALGATETILVGTGGSAGTAGGDGGAGGASQFGGHVMAPGGAGGNSNMVAGTTPATSQGVAGANPGTGDLAIGGGAGGPAIRLSATYCLGGAGGDSQLGEGGLARSTQGTGLAPRGYGAGASGAVSLGDGQIGGPGGNGIVIVELFG